MLRQEAEGRCDGAASIGGGCDDLRYALGGGEVGDEVQGVQCRCTDADDIVLKWWRFSGVHLEFAVVAGRLLFSFSSLDANYLCCDPTMMQELDQAISATQARLLALRHPQGWWEGHLSSSALSTATAIVALRLVDRVAHEGRVDAGAIWLVENQNADGGWGDTTISKSNLSTTLLCWSALHLCAPQAIDANRRAEVWITGQVGSLEAGAISSAVVARYGKDRTFSVPILMLCALCGTLGEPARAWRRVLALPFELAALPRRWFGAIGLPVVSYALPALIAIGHLRFQKNPPAFWNPLRWLRTALWPRIRPMLKELQPSSGGYLEATPLTSFVTMALAGSGDAGHPCVPLAVEFLQRSQRDDGAWPIDTNLATWGTTLSVKALAACGHLETKGGAAIRDWLAGQQYKVVHPFTNAAPGGWAWTDLPGGVPDADDTPGAMIALHHLGSGDAEAMSAGSVWLLDLQNRDGGMPTFCRGWGTLPFDRSTPELTAHALHGWWLWRERLPIEVQSRIDRATLSGLRYLQGCQRADGSWIPLWFGNEHAAGEDNPVYGTAQVVGFLAGVPNLAAQARQLIESGTAYLLATQKEDGTWGGDGSVASSIEESGAALAAVCRAGGVSRNVIERGARGLIALCGGGDQFPAAPIGLYFARLWYHEELYPLVWALTGLGAARSAMRVPGSGLGD